METWRKAVEKFSLLSCCLARSLTHSLSPLTLYLSLSLSLIHTLSAPTPLSFSLSLRRLPSLSPTLSVALSLSF